MPTREEKLHLLLGRLADLPAFTIAEAKSSCESVTPQMIHSTIRELLREGLLSGDASEPEGRLAWSRRPDDVEVRSWVARQVRGVQVTQTPPEQRPRERLLKDGPATLSEADLLAILIRVGIRGESAVDAGRKLANFVAGDLSALRSFSVAEVKAVSRAINVVSYSQIMAGVELGRRIAAAEARKERPSVRINSSAAAVAYCCEAFADLGCDGIQEEFHIVTLDTKHKPIRTHRVTVGTLDASLVHPREVFRPAIRDAAAAVLLVHNHPSGDPTPSREDRQVTDRLMEAGRLIGIDVLDHIIVTRGGGVSIRES
jgi:DNA repair protein RadC